MTLGRREFLAGASLAIAAGEPPAALASAADGELASDWEAVRRSFALSEGTVHMSAMLVASHPAPVRAAIERHRAALDADPVTYLAANNSRLEEEAAGAAGTYLGVEGRDVALTDSTTMGLGLVYGGLPLSEGDEILTTEQDYFVTHEALRLAARRTGARVRRIDLHEDAAGASGEQLVRRVAGALTPATRLVALTWVHSSTGLKLPARPIAAAIAEANAGRDPEERILFCLDGVHGFGVEDETLDSLGCDVFVAGCHKWLFGPRGTGIVAARPDAWARLVPTIPSFRDGEVFSAWLEQRDPEGPVGARAMTPGGFKPFEHRWALPEAFAFHAGIGKGRLAARTHELATQLKQALAGLEQVTVRTPPDPALSSGIVAFDVEGLAPPAAVARLRERGVIASVSPYAVAHVRLTPCVRNTPAEIDLALAAVRDIAGR